MLTKENLLWEKSFPELDFTQYVYRYENGYEMSVIHTLAPSPKWEVEIIKYIFENRKGGDFKSVLEVSCDMDIIETEEEANVFIAQAGEYLSKLEEL